MADAKINKAIIAVNRFGLGAKGAELSDAKYDPQRWLLQQLVSPVFNETLANTELAFKTIAEMKAIKRRKGEVKGRKIGPDFITPYRHRLSIDSLSLSIKTNAPFAMRLLDFFSNHFSVSASNQTLIILSPTLEREAIAPNLFGRFEDMLIAVEQHPGMLVYLNNEKSVGPNSPVGKRKRGLNENLAREIFELHTLGVNGNYTLKDISHLSMAISGWSVTRDNESERAGFKFRFRSHEPGERNVLGRSYAEGGVAQGESILRDLARHRKTANFVSYKLAQHLIADEPPKELIYAMTDTWIKTDGNIKAVVTTLVKHSQSWNNHPQKFKTPREFVVSACRGINSSQSLNKDLLNFALRGISLMGQKPFNARSPAGYSQLNSAWTGSDALMKRIDWVNGLSKKSRHTHQAIAERIFDSKLSPLTVKLLAGAESRAQGLAMFLLSPEFQRR